MTHTNLSHSLKTHIHFLDKTKGRVPAQSFLLESFVCVGAFIQRARWRIKAISKQSLLLAESEAINFSTLYYREQHKELQQMELQRGHSEGTPHRGRWVEGGGVNTQSMPIPDTFGLLIFTRHSKACNFSSSLMLMNTYSAELIYMPSFCTLFHWLMSLWVQIWLIIIFFSHISLALITFTFTFTFMHLADAFIQSDLHCIQVTVSTFLSALAFPGNRTHDFGVASAMLYQLSYRKAGLSFVHSFIK